MTDASYPASSRRRGSLSKDEDGSVNSGNGTAPNPVRRGQPLPPAAGRPGEHIRAVRRSVVAITCRIIACAFCISPAGAGSGVLVQSTS
jgi:hypothetical protein